MNSRILLRFAALLLFLLLCLPDAKAQYNNAYEITYPYGTSTLSLSGRSLDIVEADPGNQCVLSSIENLKYLFGTLPSEQFPTLKKIDQDGNVLWDAMYYFSDTFYKFQPWRLIKTLDEGYLIVGRAFPIHAPNGTSALANPFAIKVDQSGSVQWSNIYQSNYVAYYDSIQTTVTRVEDDSTGTESYIIVRSGSADQRYEYRGDICINALRIDVNGNLLWNKKYHLQSRVYEDSVVSDYPATIAYVPDSLNGNFYFIAGTRRNMANAFGSRDSSLFFIGINRDGSVVRPYRWLHVPGYPFNEDAIYDNSPGEEKIVLSYTHGNSKLVDFRQRSNRSQVGIMKLDKSLGITMMKYYWAPELYENQAVRIKRNYYDDAYVVACNVVDSPFSGLSHIGQLKVDKSGNPQHYYYYNVRRGSSVYGLLSSFNSNTGAEQYEMVGFRSSKVTPLSDFRIMATDANGITCGSEPVHVLDSNYFDSVRFRQYTPVDTDGYWSIYTQPDISFQKRYVCDSMQAPYFRKAGSAISPSEALSVYPTVLNPGQTSLTIATGTEKVRAELYTYDGRRVAATSLTGAGNMQWRLPELAPGMYLLRIKAAGVNKTYRITKL